jgi:serine/threonine-protein kinase RsbW
MSRFARRSEVDVTGMVELEFPARPEYLALARLVVAATASIEPRFRDERIDDLRVAVSEATTNAIEAHAHLDGVERIHIRCNLADDRIEVEVQDHGPGIDLDQIPAMPDLTEVEGLARQSGFGLPLMQILTDETEIRSSPDGTAVKLVVLQRRSC